MNYATASTVEGLEKNFSNEQPPSTENIVCKRSNKLIHQVPTFGGFLFLQSFLNFFSSQSLKLLRAFDAVLKLSWLHLFIH